MKLSPEIKAAMDDYFVNVNSYALLQKVVNEYGFKIKEEMKFEQIKTDDRLSEDTKQYIKETNVWLEGINNRIKEEQYSIEYNERQIKILQDGIDISKRQIEHYTEGAKQASKDVLDMVEQELKKEH